jgi:hypothetical protein
LLSVDWVSHGVSLHDMLINHRELIAPFIDSWTEAFAIFDAMHVASRCLPGGRVGKTSRGMEVAKVPPRKMLCLLGPGRSCPALIEKDR